MIEDKDYKIDKTVGKFEGKRSTLATLIEQPQFEAKWSCATVIHRC